VVTPRPYSLHAFSVVSHVDASFLPSDDSDYPFRVSFFPPLLVIRNLELSYYGIAFTFVYAFPQK
jgi:hypothetical protein